MWSTAIRRRLGPAVPGLRLLLCLAGLGAGCQRTAGAQIAAEPLGPIECFKIVEARGLASQTALDLCTGATSAAPGQCFAATLDRRGDLTNQQVLQLCQGATSRAPRACVERLDAVGTLTIDQTVGYCTTRCPLGPAPAEVSDAGCLAAALERSNLALQTAGELCRRSLSAGPVDCFVVGSDTTALTDSQLVQLCARRWSCQYINVPPAPGP